MLRGDLSSRYQAYSIATQAGFKSINEIKRLEDEPAVEGGDAFRVPLANVNVNSADLSAMEAKVNMAECLVNAGYDPEAVLKELGLPAIPYVGMVHSQPMPVSYVESPGEEEDTTEDVAEDLTESESGAS